MNTPNPQAIEFFQMAQFVRAARFHNDTSSDNLLGHGSRWLLTLVLDSGQKDKRLLKEHF